MKAIKDHVVPRAGTWIETLNPAACVISLLPVVPRAGTWIETGHNVIGITDTCVVPRAGTWIETSFC